MLAYENYGVIYPEKTQYTTQKTGTVSWTLDNGNPLQKPFWQIISLQKTLPIRCTEKKYSQDVGNYARRFIQESVVDQTEL